MQWSDGSDCTCTTPIAAAHRLLRYWQVVPSTSWVQWVQYLNAYSRCEEDTASWDTAAVAAAAADIVDEGNAVHVHLPHPLDFQNPTGHIDGGGRCCCTRPLIASVLEGPDRVMTVVADCVAVGCGVRCIHQLYHSPLDIALLNHLVTVSAEATASVMTTTTPVK